MEYALIKAGKVENVIVADEAFINLISGEWDHIERIDTSEERALGVGIGWDWDGTQFVAPPAPEPAPEPAPPEWTWYIDPGAFFDRFGSAKMAVLTSADAGVKAILSDTQIRKWIDLKLPSVAEGIDYVASVVPSVTQEVKDAILNTPVADHENIALRKLYFSA